MTRSAELVADYLRLQRTGQNAGLKEYGEAWRWAEEINQEARSTEAVG